MLGVPRTDSLKVYLQVPLSSPQRAVDWCELEACPPTHLHSVALGLAQAAPLASKTSSSSPGSK